MRYSAVAVGVAAAATLATPASAGFNPGSSDNVAVYWGQNSFGQGAGPLAQQRLVEYCANSNIDASHVRDQSSKRHAIDHPPVLFGRTAGCTPIPGSRLFYCPELEQDIQTCQNTYGKTILLSLGGATTGEPGFASAGIAHEKADKIWASFGPNTGDSSVPRPFGNAIVDGFDLDYEHEIPNLAPFVQQLQRNADASGKHYIFSAAPQCFWPDAALGNMLGEAGKDLANQVSFDFIQVQFYNNYNGAANFIKGSNDQPIFNFNVWDTWAKTTSKNPNVKILMGVLGNVKAGNEGHYVPVEVVQNMIEYSRQFSSFGGVMVWEASQAYANGGFLEGIRSTLGSSPAPIAGPGPVEPATPIPEPVASTTTQEEVAMTPTETAAPEVEVTVAPKTPAYTTIDVPVATTTSVIKPQATPAATSSSSYPAPSDEAVDEIEESYEPEEISEPQYVDESEYADAPEDIDEAYPTQVYETPMPTAQSTEVTSQTSAPTTTLQAQTSSSSIPTSTVAPGREVAEYEQCAGIDYTGPTECEEGLVCTMGNSDWWWACKKPIAQALEAKSGSAKKKSKDGLKKEYRSAAGKVVSVPALAVAGGTIVAVLAYVL